MMAAIARRDAEADLRALRGLGAAIAGALSHKGGAAFERLANDLEARAIGSSGKPDRRAAARLLADAVSRGEAKAKRRR